MPLVARMLRGITAYLKDLGVAIFLSHDRKVNPYPVAWRPVGGRRCGQS